MFPSHFAVAALGLTLSLAAQAPRRLYTLPSPTPGQWLIVQQHFDALDSCCGVMRCMLRQADLSCRFCEASCAKSGVRSTNRS